MLLRDLMEGYGDQLLSDANGLIASFKGEGREEIQTEVLVDMLVQMGHMVNIHSIMGVLSKVPMISAANPTVITLKPPESSIEGDRESDDINNSKEQVAKMADAQI